MIRGTESSSFLADRHRPALRLDPETLRQHSGAFAAGSSGGRAVAPAPHQYEVADLLVFEEVDLGLACRIDSRPRIGQLVPVTDFAGVVTPMTVKALWKHGSRTSGPL